MPTYEYRCRDCHAPLEVVQSIHDAALTECPQCHGTLRKVFSNVGVVFKGSGFYRTDNRSKTRASGSEPSKSEPSKSEPVQAESSRSGDAGKAGATQAPDSTSSGAKSGESTKPAASKATAGAAAS